MDGGIPGEGSLVHKYGTDWRTGFINRAILLLQVAHPVVGAGVADHSDFVNDRWGRITRTVTSMHRFLGLHGDDAGRAEAARLRDLHRGIKGVDGAGRRYSALNPEAYLWVHATLFHGWVPAPRNCSPARWPLVRRPPSTPNGASWPWPSASPATTFPRTRPRSAPTSPRWSPTGWRTTRPSG